MSDDFSSSRRLQERSSEKEPFVSKARHIHRFHRPQTLNRAKREAERDRIIFLWIMAAIVAVGIVVAVGMFLINRTTSVD
jgi:hypothetical protein